MSAEWVREPLLLTMMLQGKAFRDGDLFIMQNAEEVSIAEGDNGREFRMERVRYWRCEGKDGVLFDGVTDDPSSDIHRWACTFSQIAAWRRP